MRLAIISPNRNNYSETFIKAHIDLLEGDKFFLYGSYKPLYYSERSIIQFVPFFNRVFVKIFYKNNLLKYSIKYFLRKKNIHVILAEYGPTGCAVMDIANELKIPLVVHFHGYDASSKKLIIEYYEQYKRLFNIAKNIVVVSLKMRNDLIKIGAEEHKLVYAPCGPAAVFKDVHPDYERSETALFVGRFVDKKAPWILIEVMKKVLKKVTNIKLVMVGDGVLFDTCKGLVKIYGLENHVILPGAVSHEEVRKLMANSFCYIQHSITTIDGETEGTPVSILEASQAGLPVISTRHAGIPDIIIHKGTGFLVNEFEIDGMAEYLLFLNSNRELAREMGLKAKKRISENFSLEQHISTLNNVIKKVIERH